MLSSIRQRMPSALSPGAKGGPEDSKTPQGSVFDRKQRLWNSIRSHKMGFFLPTSRHELEKDPSSRFKRSRLRILFGSLFLLLTVKTSLSCLHSLDYSGKKFVRMAASRFWVILEEWKVYKPVPTFDLNYADTYPELKVLEENHPIIREEAENLLKIKDDLVPLSEILGTAGIHKTTWTTFFLQIDVGGTIEENAKYAPKTAAIIKDIPGVYTAFFSILDADTHLPAHWGYYKGFVRYHLGVVIPNNNVDKKCWIRTNTNYPFNPEHEAAVTLGDRTMIENQEKYYWKNGEGVMFDDNYIHEAKNESDEPRVVLFLDVARKMPWYASIVNRIMLFVSMNDNSMKTMRANAKVQLRSEQKKA